VFLFFAVIAGALVVAVVVGGDVRRLSQIRVKHLELLIGAFGLKLVVALLGTAHSELAVNIARPLNVVGAVLLLAVVWFNRRIPGALLFGAGLVLNLAAIVSFGCLSFYRAGWTLLRLGWPRFVTASIRFTSSCLSPTVPGS